ncbi:MAG: nucleotidyl transferase AbiEii/AbiGii toxin family protein [Sedimentisphaerales bacterium]|nr:nucleotidyl transferase AbiEii/AbiGii toxin family protein [Sedimentisphaerales bacterium]
MEIQKDFKELLELFNAHRVEYIIVGGYALAFHGAPRFTGDIDLLVNPDNENARRIIAALKDFGFGSLDLGESDFTTLGNVIQLGVPPIRIDIMTSLTGIDWKSAQGGSVAGDYGGLAVRFLGKKEYVANKKAIGRKKDLADLEALGED